MRAFFIRLAGTQAAVTITPKPKRPMTAYFRFLNEVRPETIKNNPNVKPTELMKIIGQKWAQLDDRSKEKYAQGYKNEMEVYKTKQAALTIPPKPKRPMTAYFRFLNEVRPEAIKNNPNMKPTELTKVIGQKWTQLDDRSKEKYAQGFKSEMEAYNTMLDKYLKSLTPEQRDAQEQLKIDRLIRKEKQEKKKNLLQLGKPNKSPTAL